MRMCRSVSDGLHATGSASKRDRGRGASYWPIAGGGVQRIFPCACSTLLSKATYGHVSKLFDSGHFLGAVSWQHNGRSAEIRNGQLSSATPDAMPRSAIATQYATTRRTVSD